VTEADSTFCKTPEDKFFDHFSRIFQQGKRTDLTIPTEVPPYTDSDTEDQNPFTGEFMPEEVWTQLHCCSSTTEGLDGINYVQWKKNDRGGYALNTAFNAVHRLGYITQAWGKSVTVLINKKGEESDISNWHPITPSNTISKLYSSILAIRLGRWAACNEKSAPLERSWCQLMAAASISLLSHLRTDMLPSRMQEKQKKYAPLVEQ
jgi:hypothetical protein